MKENDFILTNARSKLYSVLTITDADYVDDKTLQANTPVQAKSLLHSLEKATCGIGRHVNSDKKGICYLIKIKKKDTSPH